MLRVKGDGGKLKGKKWWWLWYPILSFALCVEAPIAKIFAQLAITKEKIRIYEGYTFLSYLFSFFMALIGMVYMLVKFLQIKKDLKKGILANYEFMDGIIWGILVCFASLFKNAVFEEINKSVSRATIGISDPYHVYIFCGLILEGIFFLVNFIYCICLHAGFRDDYNYYRKR